MTELDWFRQNNRNVLEELIRKHDVRSVLEIGSFLGESAQWFAQRVEHVVCVDRWRIEADSPGRFVETLGWAEVPSDFYAIFEERMKAAGVWDKLTIIRGDSHDPAIAELIGMVDLVYIDGDHSEGGCGADIQMYGPKAKRVIAGDDYDPVHAGVIAAVDRLLPGRQVSQFCWWAVK